MVNPPEPANEPEAISIRALVEYTPQDPNPTGRYTPCDPMDNYTTADMPKVHDAHPTSPFNFIDLDLISKWENLAGGKVLVIPFGECTNKADLHELIKNRILYAMAEITHSQGVGVSAPTPSAEAIRAKCYPTSFLVYNLTPAQKKLILDKRVWSSQAITLHATPFFPTIPDLMFTISGFSMLLDTQVGDLILSVWRDDITTTFAQSLINNAPEGERATLAPAIQTLLDSMTTSCLNIKERGGGLIPCYNIYANGSAIPRHTTWLELCTFLSNRVYFTPMQGRSTISLRPYNCGICHGVDHPKRLCAFPDIPGWKGPRRNQNNNHRGRNGGLGQLNQPRYGAGPNFNNGAPHM
jgi:hypothetical protein